MIFIIIVCINLFCCFQTIKGKNLPNLGSKDLDLSSDAVEMINVLKVDQKCRNLMKVLFYFMRSLLLLFISIVLSKRNKEVCFNWH